MPAYQINENGPEVYIEAMAGRIVTMPPAEEDSAD